MFDITNYSDHPTRIGYTVFKFYEKQRADYFEQILQEKNLWYESSIDDNGRLIYLFGVRKGDFKEVMKANYLVSAKYRKRTISNKYFGWAIILVALTAIILAIIGALVKT